jgi:trk system potassium uptake protein TrkH
MRPVLANLGFVLQLAGILTLLPIGVAFYYRETDALISFFLTAIALLGSGFILNSLAEKREPDFKTSAALITLVFLLLGLFGSIPLLYLGVFPGGPLEAFTNSYFEATSGFTTTGFSLISDVDALPRSLIFYRALTQFIGGIGLVFILLAFLYPGRALIPLGRAVGAENLTTDMRRTFLIILLIYSLYAGLFSLTFYS